MWPYPKVLAHRGGGKLAPENTLAALRCGLAHGYRAVEFDVMLARDKVAVLMHDPELGRTVHGSGMVYEHDGAALARMDAGAWFGPEFAGEPVPTYTEVLAFCQAHGIWMNVELKPAPGFEYETGAVVAAMTAAAYAPDDPLRPLLSSFEPAALEGARVAAPGLPRAHLFDAIPADWAVQAAAQQVVAVHCNQRHLTPELARAIRAAGYGLFCYTVNDAARARTLLGWGVEAFCTDRIDAIGADFAD